MKIFIFHLVIWMGIYWGASQNIELVGYTVAVGMTLYGIFWITVTGTLHFVFSTNSDWYAGSIMQNRVGPILSRLIMVSSFAQALFLISIGGWWLVPGILWAIAVLLADSLVFRARQVARHYADST